MREIKFRAWDKDVKKFADMCAIHIDGDIMASSQTFGGMYGVVPEEMEDRILLQQYTGLKDKNGVEIYEGDIVAARHPEDEDCDMDMVRAVVLYSAPSFYAKYIDESLNAFVSGNSGFILRPQSHVIGNIYENPELLEKL